MIHYSCTSCDRFKKQPQNHAMFIPQVHCIMKLREFESTHYFWMISNSVPIYFTYFTYAWSRCLKPKYGPPINIHPKSGHSSYGDHTFLEPPKIQNSNWESLQKKQSFVTLELLWLNLNFRILITLDPKKTPIVGFFWGIFKFAMKHKPVENLYRGT